MISFKSSKIFLDSETVAEQLHQARQAKKLKLKPVAQKLKINYRYLKALEKGDYQKLPDGIYGKNFLREYAQFLGLDYQSLLAAYDLEKKFLTAGQQQQLFSRKIVKKRYLLIFPKLVKNLLIALVIIVCFIYLGFRVSKILASPILFIYQPAENLITTKNIIEVTGKTEKEVKITINDEAILTDTNGNFSKIINLKNGLNLINITASKKYGHEKTITRQVLVKDQTSQ